MGRSPREIYKDISVHDSKKKGVFAKSNHKKIMSSNQSKRLETKKFKQITQTLEINPNKYQNSVNIGRAKNHSFKSETGEFGSLSKKDFGKMEYQTGILSTWKTRERKKGGKTKGFKNRNEKSQLDSVMPECVSIYKKLDVQAISKKGGRRITVSYTHLRAHETDSYLVCRLLLEKKK